MATASQPDFIANASWQDIVATIGGVANAAVLIQNLDGDKVQVVFGGASAPTGKSGVFLNPYDSMSGTSDHVWVRGDDSCKLSVTLV